MQSLLQAFGDGESDKKKHRFIEDDASDGTMIARQGNKAHFYSFSVESR